MEEITRLKKEAIAAGENHDFHFIGFNLDAKLALLKHALVYGAEELDDWSISGLACLVSDITADVNATITFSQKCADYFAHAKNPQKFRDECNDIARHRPGGRICKRTP
ncbi:hypothetical protein [Desulforhopalus singaporensis]|uniref:Uncharacterized protein n=1 Tax=Desulforhopalus singaporensis TaxID=91360 RepID=A0A1H0VCK1_9BACT|nr:hypothetical protein [Desulforhopalus singaporensis]SDP75965.1 hypothetical protein SAMN05660330_03985 [Desulforhopalus singaporensis]